MCMRDSARLHARVFVCMYVGVFLLSKQSFLEELLWHRHARHLTWEHMALLWFTCLVTVLLEMLGECRGLFQGGRERGVHLPG